MRVFVVGGGSAAKFNGAASCSGGGGGGAATKLNKPSTIEFSIGRGGQTTGQRGGEDSSALFLNYHLIGGGGKCPAAGVGSGGDYNFNGSPGETVGGSRTPLGGGGAAGPNGNGGDFSGIGWGPGGGGYGGAYRYLTNNEGAGGGGGTGAPGGAAVGASYGGASQGIIYKPIFGKTPLPVHNQAGNGGEMGGGGAMVYFAELEGRKAEGNGGVGGMVVEWFFND